MRYLSLTALFLLASFLPAFSQKKLSIEELFTTPSLQPKQLKGVQWLGESDSYAMPDQESSEYLLRYAVSGKKPDTLLKASQLGSSLKKIPAITWLNSAEFYFEGEENISIYNIATRQVRKACTINKDWERTDFETRNFSVAYTRKNNLFVNIKGEDIQITNDKNEEIVSGRSVHREEFGITKGTFWSPAGNLLAFYRMDQTMVTDYPLVNLGSFPAKAEMIKYPMAGQASHHVQLGVFNLQSRQTIYLQTGEPLEQYLTNIAWTPDEKYILIAVVNRAQNEMKLNQYRVADGSCVKTLFTETDAEWVEPLHPAAFLPGNTEQFIWQSERSGTNQLYLYGLDGKLIQQLSTGNFTVTSYLGCTPDGKQFFAEIADNNGLDRKLLQTDRSGKMKIISSAPGVHNTLLSYSKKFFIDQYTSLSVPRKVSLHQSSGKELRVLFEANDPLKQVDLVRPELLTIKASDGTVLNGRIFKPSGMEQGRRYPVLLYVYGGPHAQMVSNRWMGGANLWLSWMASRGYVVFTLDNRGSGDRGQAFEQVIHRKLGQTEMEDQMLGLRYLKALPFVDSTKIGVHGWSFGGFMTTSLMCNYPSQFKAGVGGGPVIDWKMYEIMYTERYMDTPQENPEGYRQTSLLNKASALKDRLMLIHCTSDDVVVWQHSQEFVKKCVDAGVLLDYMIYPGHGHNVQGKDRLHLMRTITRYFDEHLLD